MKSRVRTSVVVVHNAKVLCFLGIDPTNQKEFYFLPGGKIESGETAPEAAERETFEETGYQVTVEPTSCVDKEYEFHWDGIHWLVLTFFYRARLNNPFQAPTEVKDADYNKGTHWIPLSEIDHVFSYTPEILEAIKELANIENQSPSLQEK